MRGMHLLPAARGLTLLRLMAGGVMTLAGASKMSLHWLAGALPLPVASTGWQAEFPHHLGQRLASHPEGITAAVIRDLILPHGALFAGTLAWLQLLSGLLLLLGLMTRLASLVVGAILAGLALIAASSGNISSRFYLVLGCVVLALLIGDAGQTFGLDGWRRERRRGRDM